MSVEKAIRSLPTTFLLASLPLIGVIIGAGLNHRYSTIRGTESRLNEQRERAYSDYFANNDIYIRLGGINAAGENKQEALKYLALRNAARFRIAFLGSERTVSALAMHVVSDDCPGLKESYRSVWESISTDLFVAMRTDITGEDEPPVTSMNPMLDVKKAIATIYFPKANLDACPKVGDGR